MDSILEDSVDEGNLADDLVDTIPEMFTDEHTLDYSSPPLYDKFPGPKLLLLFSSENEEEVFNLGILTSKGVHTSLLSKLSHRGPKAFKVIKIFEKLMEIFPCSYGEDIRILDVPCLHFYPP
ncbi:hypothetical protein Tco_0665314 [Tanacetum coccineum]